MTNGTPRPRLLVLTPRFPYPVIGGDRLRIYKICEVLSRDYDVDLLSLCENKEELQLSVPSDGVFSSIRRVFLPRWKSWLNCALAVLKGEPLQVAYYRSSEFHRTAVEMAREVRLVIAHLIRTADVARTLDVPRVLEMTDAISLNYQRARRHFNPLSLRSILYSVEARRVRKYERQAMRNFDVCVLVSSIDQQYLRDEREDSSDANLVVCTNGVDSSFFWKDYSHNAHLIVFIGNMRSYQNSDAVTHFVRSVFPQITSENPDVRFRVIGRIGPVLRRYLSSLDGVETTGEVVDIPSAARGASVGVCPIRIGAGIQNKVLEYMALGIPTVTSSVGLEGLEALPGIDLLVADRPREFARCVCEILTDNQVASALSESGRRYVAQHHTWEKAFLPLKRQLASLIDLHRIASGDQQ